jgi:DNA-binding response OmpR family regulator
MTQRRTTSDLITVLLVDDDTQLRRFCREFLKGVGFRVLEAADGLEALLTMIQQQGTIDLLITDLAMPGMSGAELGRAFRKMWPSVKVLFMSGMSREAVAEEIPPGCPFLPKPFLPAGLVAAVDACIGQRGKHATNTSQRLSRRPRYDQRSAGTRHLPLLESSSHQRRRCLPG